MSPVYEHGYEPWEGERTSRGHRILAIAQEGLRASMRSRWVWVLLAVTLVHVAIRGGILYFTGQVDVGQGGIPPGARERITFTEGFMADAMGLQARWILMLLLALVASPALARDLDAGALAFYFSKPVTRTGYAVGKLAAPFLLGLAVTALPVLLLWVLGVAFTPEALHPGTVASMPIRILAAGALVSLGASLVASALSGLVRSTTLAAGTWVGLAVLSAGAAQLLVLATGRSNLGLVDLFGAFERVNDAILGVSGGLPLEASWLVTLGWMAAGIGGLAWVLREPEVTT